MISASKRGFTRVMAAYTYAYTYAYLGSRIQQSAAKVINYGSSPLQLNKFAGPSNH